MGRRTAAFLSTTHALSLFSGILLGFEALPLFLLTFESAFLLLLRFESMPLPCPFCLFYFIAARRFICSRLQRIW